MAGDHDRDDSPPSGLSRRQFLRGGAAVGALGTAGMLVGEIAEGAKKAAQGPTVPDGMEVWGPGPVPIRLRINDKPYDLKLEPRTTLLDALREELDFTGAKRVCDRGTCGACTVIVDGKAVYSCSILAIDAQRRPIETIEGLARPDGLHPISAALLDQTPNPNLKEVHHGLSGNFCRCGTYAGMRQAVLDAAAHMNDDDKAKDNPKDKPPAAPAAAPPKGGNPLG
jgi:xanthine dehydrogenase YagT iron-sulfur-binding subunit